MTKKVAVSQRIDVHEEIREQRDALDQRLAVWISEAGYLPYPVPNYLRKRPSDDKSSRQPVLEDWVRAIRPEAIILSGGNNIGEFSQRDDTERYLLSWAKQHQLPVLGICRGMQMISVWAGTELKKVDGHVRTRHKLTVVDKNREWAESVNSYHDFGVSSCPEGFRVLARSEDGLIEAIRHQTHPWEGWMWHPEREDEFSPADLKQLRALFENTGLD